MKLQQYWVKTNSACCSYSSTEWNVIVDLFLPTLNKILFYSKLTSE